MHRFTARSLRLAMLALSAPLLACHLARAQGTEPEWADVARILKTADTPTSGYHRYNFPRRDVTVHLGDVTVATAMAFGAWAGFSGTPGDAVMMGDLVLLPTELKPVQAELARQHIDITAIHNHLSGESPEIIYVHYHAMGAITELATRLDRVLAQSAIPRPVAAAGAPPPLAIDTAEVFRVLGIRGRATGNVVQISVVLVSGTVTMDGRTVFPALGYGTPINLQAVSPTRMVATGDFSVTARQLQPIVNALAAHGITATALHSHLRDETPHIYYMHFWADGPTAEVLAGLRSALDAAK